MHWALGEGVRFTFTTNHNLKPLPPMLSWSITFLIIAIIAAVLGFGGIAGTAVGIAKLLFFIFIVLFILSLIFGRRPKV